MNSQNNFEILDLFSHSICLFSAITAYDKAHYVRDYN
jgi:hypothetical protein